MQRPFLELTLGGLQTHLFILAESTWQGPGPFAVCSLRQAPEVRPSVTQAETVAGLPGMLGPPLDGPGFV